MNHRLLALFSTQAILALTLISGCGGADTGGRNAVSGSVSYDGKPIDNGRITFIQVDGKPPQASGDIVDGKYTIEAVRGPLAGSHRVEIHWNKKTGKKIMNDPPNFIEEVKQMLPEKYNLRTTLNADVKSGSNVFDFALQK